MPLFIVPLGGSASVPIPIGGAVIRQLVASCGMFGWSGTCTATVMPGNGLTNAMLGILNALPAPGAVAVTLPAPEMQPCGLANIVIVIGGVATIVIVIDDR